MPVIHLQYASEGRWRSPGVMNGIALNWVALPVSPPRVRFEVSVLGESWLGMGVSADGKMAFSPAIIAAWPRSQEARGDQRDPTKAGYLAPTTPLFFHMSHPVFPISQNLIVFSSVTSHRQSPRRRCGISSRGTRRLR